MLYIKCLKKGHIKIYTKKKKKKKKKKKYIYI